MVYEINSRNAFVNMTHLANLLSRLYMRPQMKRLGIAALCLVILAGCARLEISREGLYPFRAEFLAEGTVRGEKTAVSGALVLHSAESGVIQAYGPGGLGTYAVDILPEALIIRDMWGRQADEVDLPVPGAAGLVAGDMPDQAYLYREETSGGTRLVYPWGILVVDEKVLPREVHVPSGPGLDISFSPQGRDVILDVVHGPDTLQVRFTIIEGGRWAAP